MNILLSLLLLLAGNHVNLKTIDFVFGNCGKSEYTWFNPWGGFVAKVRDTHDSDGQWSRWTISQDGMTAMRSVYRAVDGWLVTTDEISLAWDSVDGDWEETARQTYQGSPKYLPVTINAPGWVRTTGRWSWNDPHGHVGQGDLRYTNTWTLDGDRLVVDEFYEQRRDGKADWETSHRLEYFTRQGFIGFNDKAAGYVACVRGAVCK